MSIERISVENVHPLVWGDHIHRYIWASRFSWGHVLDVACGVGYGNTFLRRSAAVSRYTGVDISAEAVAVANRLYGSDRVEFRIGDCLALPFPDQSFDTVVSFETLEHVDDPGKAIVEIARILKEDGVFVGSVPSRSQEELISDLYGKNPFHKHLFDESVILNLLKGVFENITLFWQSMEIFNIIRSSGRIHEDFIAFNDNLEFGSYGAGSILFVATRRPLELRNYAMASVLPAMNMLSLEKNHIYYVRSLREQLQLSQEMVAQLQDKLQTLVQQHETLVQQHETLVQQHETLVQQHETLVQQHWLDEQRFKELKRENEVLRRWLTYIDREFILPLRRMVNSNH